MKFHRHCWYVAALPDEVSRTLLARKIIDIPVLLFRREDKTIVAISNVCPHRFAPLDRGTLLGDSVQCKYHGLRFGGDGRCNHNPYTDRIDAKMHIASYPVVERHGLVWIWMGTGAVDPETIPDMSAHEDNETQHVVRSYLFTNYRYDILIDNLMDLSHADYLHDGSFSTGKAESTTITVREERDEVIVDRLQLCGPPPPYFSFLGDLIDTLTAIHWHPGQVIGFRSQSSQTGTPIEEGVAAHFAHIATPADENHTHYFMSLTLNGPADPTTDESARLGQLVVIENEDGPMLDAVDAHMRGQDLMSMQPLVLPVDAGGLRVRRVMKRLLAAEA